MKNNIIKGEKVFVHARAYIAGEVRLGSGANIWCGACIRGDLAPVIIGENANVQDNATIHVGAGLPAVLGSGVTVGHNAVVHGCTVGNNVLIGMGAVIQDGASVGDNCIVGAGTLIPPRKAIPAGSVVFGSPYRLVRTASEADLAAVRANAAAYLRLAEEYAEENAAENL